MNDPFDVYIDDLFDVSINEIHQRWVPQLFEILEHDPVGFASQVDADPGPVTEVYCTNLARAPSSLTRHGP
jgi:hypothetical protein